MDNVYIDVLENHLKGAFIIFKLHLYTTSLIKKRLNFYFCNKDTNIN